MKYGFFFFVALLVTLPWFFNPGYLLLLDWQGTPVLPGLHLDATGGFSGIPIQVLMHFISFITNGAVAQKVIVFLILGGIGYGTALLVSTMLSTSPSRFIPYIAGVFAMLNPFVYNRIQMGHIYLLAGYALTPFAILFVLRFFHKPSIRAGIAASVVSSLVIATSIHHIILLPLVAGVFVWNERRNMKISPIHYLSLLGPFVCVALLILLLASVNPMSTLRSLGTEDLFAFAPVMQCSKNIVLDTLLLNAQWRNPTVANLPCRQPIFFAAEILLLCLAILGAKKNKRLAIGAIFFVILSAIPVLPAMRDSGKFLGNLALLESVLLAYGIVSISQTKKYMAVLSWVLVCILGFPLLWGLSGTIVPRQYPASWYEWNAQLSAMPEKPRMLFLPWHLYMPFDFTNHAVIGNPAVNFFTHATVIQGDNLEMEQGSHRITTQSTRDISRNVEVTFQELHTDTFSHTFKELLRNERIRYIALSDGLSEKELYKDTFGTLSYLHIQYDQPGLTIYMVEE